ncbi:MAG TPA: MFS transporter [Solirubrobacterales bacterium]|nr:MFS transporter [Solirubrobacterales bacterium]
MFEWANEALPASLSARERPRSCQAGPPSPVGGTRARTIGLLAAVLALQSADLATVGAVGGQLEGALGIDHFQLGLLVAVASVFAAAATLPFGVLADRLPRVRLLAGSVGLWAAAMLATGFAGSFAELLLCRVLLGVVVAAAGPLLASLMGDLFPSAERARVYGYVLSGELVGAGFGFLVSGNVAGLLSWRWAFWVLSPPAIALAWALLRGLPEPTRGGVASAPDKRLAQRLASRQGVRPRRAAVVRRATARLSLRQAVAHVLRVRTNVVLIVVSATGYLFLAGVETFGVIFVRREYGLSQSAATTVLALLGLGALVGVQIGGRLADRMLARGRLDARIVVGAAAFGAAAGIVFLPFLSAWPLATAMPLFVIGTAALSCGNPPLDAARLDVMPAALWGRAEAIRTVLRSLAVTAAPLLFGWLAGAIGGGHGEGLRLSFLIMLAPLCAAGLILLYARRTYPADVAAAALSEEGAE